MSKATGFPRAGVRLFGILGLLAAGACAQNAALPAATPLDHSRARALEAVAHHAGTSTVEANGVVFTRTMTGAVRGEPVEPTGKAEPDDVALEAELRGRVASDPNLVRIVDIDVDHGVVRLCGTVADSLHAAQLIDLALALPGVRAVESSLAWISTAELQRPASAASLSPSAPRAER